RPYGVGSLAAITLGDAETACRLAARGLRLEPDSPLFRNHMAYALIEKGEYPRATEILRQALNKKPDEYAAGYLVATAGMLSMRLGDVEEGIASYRAVISVLKKQGNQSAEPSAMAFLALEAARARSPLAAEFIKQAEDLTKVLRYAPE